MQRKWVIFQTTHDLPSHCARGDLVIVLIGAQPHVAPFTGLFSLLPDQPDGQIA
jgi:hypothetical protein